MKTREVALARSSGQLVEGRNAQEHLQASSGLEAPEPAEPHELQGLRRLFASR